MAAGLTDTIVEWKGNTAWKVSKYRLFFGPYFLVFGPEKTAYLDIFYAV